tara:strand:+ start:279 stop:3647 length:3369 start_codon:yes stop_codon:yes gene_type:complete
MEDSKAFILGSSGTPSRPKPVRSSKSEMIFDSEARFALGRGVDAVADTTKITLGPLCQNVLLQTPPFRPVITNDGISIARSINLRDEYENMGAKLIIEAASEASWWAGDGTTSATILAQEMLHAGLKNIAAGANPMMLRRGIELASGVVLEELKRISVDARNENVLTQVGTVSANSNVLGELAAKAILETQPNGGVVVEEGRGLQSQLRRSTGVSMDEGYVSSAFVNTVYGKAELDNPYILITDRRIVEFGEIRRLLDSLVDNDVTSVFVMCDSVDEVALSDVLAANKNENLQLVIASNPVAGLSRSEVCEDLAIVTGGTFVSDEFGRSWDNVNSEVFGRAERVVVGPKEFLIVGPKGDPARIASRISAMQSEADRTRNHTQADLIKNRITRLSGKMITIEVSASTGTERTELCQRTENAVSACRAAYDNGVLPGGGRSLLWARSALDVLDVHGDQATGVGIVREALQRPTEQIAINAGLDGQLIVEKIESEDDIEYGFDALSRSCVNVFEAGVLDPLDVVSSSLRSATSTAVSILTTETAIRHTEKIEDIEIPGMGNEVNQSQPERRTTEILFGDNGRRSLHSGVDKLADVVKVTHGPTGMSVVLERRGLAGSYCPAVTRDGADVAREIELPDPIEDLGAQLLREAALHTESMAGDGTTTAMVLAQAIVREADMQIAAGRSPMSIGSGIRLAANYVDAYLREHAREISSKAEVERVARVSSRDSEIATAVTQIVDHTGDDGAIDVRQGRGVETTIRINNGFQAEASLTDAFFVDDADRSQTVIESPYIVAILGSVLIRDLALLFDVFTNANIVTDVVLIAEDFPTETLGALRANWRQDGPRVCPVVTNSLDLSGSEVLMDVAAVTGGQVIGDAIGRPWNSIDVNVLGKAQRVVVDMKSAVIVNGADREDGLERRKLQIVERVRERDRSNATKIAEKQLQRLSGRIGTIYVGAATQLEVKRRLQLADDAVKSVRSALTSGVVPGGGAAYLHAARSLPELPEESDVGAGVSAMRKALDDPFKSIVVNAGEDPGGILARIDFGSFWNGYDSVTGKFIDLFESGIIDPLLVSQHALAAAVSVACAIITTDTVVAERPERHDGEFEVDVATYAEMLYDDPSTKRKF